MAEASAAQPPKLSVAQKALFGVGSAAFGVKDGGFNTFLLVFYNQIIGMPPQWVGAAILIAIVVDAVADPFIGAVTDRWRSRYGRRHPFMVAAALPVAILYFALWNPPSWSHEMLFYYVLAISISVRFAIACYEIPSVALVAELSRDYDERTSILSWRLFFQLIVPAAVYIITLNTFMKETPQYHPGILNPAAYVPYAIFASLVMFGSILVSSFGTRSRIPYLKTNLDTPKVGVMQVVREAFRSIGNPSFLLVTISGIFSGMASGVGIVLAPYLGIFFWKFSSAQLSLLGLAAVIASIMAAPLAPVLSRRYGKKTSGITLAILWLIVAQLAPVMKLLGFLPPEGSNALLAIVFTTTLIAWTLILSSLILIISMITDVNEDNELKTGQRSEGVFAAASSFVNKVVTGIGIFLGSTLIAFVNLPPRAVPQTVDPEAVRQLVLINIPLQVTLISITIALLMLYRIDRKAHEDNLRRIQDALAVESKVASIADTPKLG